MERVLMAERATGINPAMLRWARERAGYSIEDVAGRRRVPPERVREWETGVSYPTWRQLEHLSYRDYHRATTFFFLNDPPAETAVGAEFRRLPSATLEDLHPDTLYAIRQARVRQSDLAILIGARGAGEKHILRDLRDQANPNDPIGLAETVREYLEIGLEDQKSWPRSDDALNFWRQQVEDAGIWVFKRSFEQKDVAGFCLDGEAFPVIYLNNGQAKTRQIFTLFHELAHLLFDFNHLERLDDRHYLASLASADRPVEIACNRFAGEFLVPGTDFEQIITDHTTPVVNDETVSDLARMYSVSREVILRKFLDRDWLDTAGYRAMVARWRAERPPSTGGGGNYYATQATYLGTKYLRAAFLAREEERIDDFQLAAFLGVKGTSLDGLERYAWRR